MDFLQTYFIYISQKKKVRINFESKRSPLLTYKRMVNYRTVDKRSQAVSNKITKNFIYRDSRKQRRVR